jgi:hypothetical protein
LLAQSQEGQGSERTAEAMKSYAHAAELAPGDGKIVSVYARKLLGTKFTDRAIDLLAATYTAYDDDPIVVENYVCGLMEVDRVDEAELVVTQASYRHGDDSRFRHIRRRFEQRVRHMKLFCRDRRESDDSKGRPAYREGVVPFRNIGNTPPGKPRGPKRPSRRRPGQDNQRPEYEDGSKPTSDLVALEEGMDLQSTLKKVGQVVTGAIYRDLGLIGKTRPHLQREQIVGALLQRTFLNTLSKKLPADSRKLLRTVVRLGGYVPASVLFQNTGPEAPPPDIVQPLLRLGLLYLGREAGKRPKNGEGLVAVIPVDLHDRLSTVLKTPVDDGAA